ncbi:MAG: ribosomal RNA adenine dimethylase [Flavobacteriales bacterium]|nr:ribosomal RNA adenine dimethylase [Flavobacteriales bacterium]
MAKTDSFIKQYRSNKKEVGAIAPSSKFLRNRMMAPINFHRADVIVELGPGTGVFTKELLKLMKPSAKLYVFETNQSFYEKLKSEIQDERITIYNESAELVKQKMDGLGIDQVDVIVSSLPYTVFPIRLKIKILNSCTSALADDGIYVQFQYSLNAHKLLKKKFAKVSLDFTPMNMPPAVVYRCRK